ncbi:MAG: class I SAM-dependent methyltransferase [Bacilli bacterium]|nr:class I SAM-dependent methyltransferase [Bacilli bacterium]
MNNINNDYYNLVSFWDKAFEIKEEDKKKVLAEINSEEDYKELAPSKKQYDALLEFKDKKDVLDYGCGSGWASIIMAKNGISHIDAVDVSNNSIEMMKLYSEAFKVSDKIKTFQVDEKWLENQENEIYDGFFSSNVIDVVPLPMALDIIKESSRILKKGSLVIYSLNYYIDPKVMEERGCKVCDKQIYIDGVLRLTSLTDSEWTDIFKKYFTDINLSYYAWNGEKEERRRLFIMKKN